MTGLVLWVVLVIGLGLKGSLNHGSEDPPLQYLLV
jgi:hypothetical protein